MIEELRPLLEQQTFLIGVFVGLQLAFTVMLLAIGVVFIFPRWLSRICERFTPSEV